MAFTVIAAGGVPLSDNAFGGTAAALVIDVGASNYLGSVTIRKGIYVTANDPILSVTAKSKTTTWKVSGTGTGTSTAALEFTKLKGNKWGWVKQAKPFSNTALGIEGGDAGAAD